MEREPQLNQEIEEKVIDGVKYRRVSSGYTVRQYFSHNTPEKGPGPGWDTKQRIFEEYNVDDTNKLPDTLYYTWEEIKDEDI